MKNILNVSENTFKQLTKRDDTHKQLKNNKTLGTKKEIWSISPATPKIAQVKSLKYSCVLAVCICKHTK